MTQAYLSSVCCVLRRFLAKKLVYNSPQILILIEFNFPTLLEVYFGVKFDVKYMSVEEKEDAIYFASKEFYIKWQILFIFYPEYLNFSRNLNCIMQFTILKPLTSLVVLKKDTMYLF